MNDSSVHGRFRLTLHYDGARFHGWQLQPERRTVQGELERILSQLFDQPTRVTGSGRTDAGVHASGQVAAADAPPGWSASKLRRALNALLPEDLWVAGVSRATPDFHPRYHAVSREYRYRIGVAAEARSPFHAPWCWPLCRPLELGSLQEVTEPLLGEHNFGAFAKQGREERGDRCRVTAAEWARWSLGVQLHISADRFLHHTVRYLVGTVVAVVLGKRPAEDVLRLLAKEEGVTTSPPAPAGGLFLRRVTYPGDDDTA